MLGTTRETSTNPAQTIEEALQIDARCVRFEQAFAAGKAPRIEDFLTETSAELLPRLTAELVAAECGLRDRAGLPAVSTAEWQRRFPQLAMTQDPFSIGHSTIGSPSATSHRMERLPRQFGDYELLRVLAAGGMGIVYQARQTGLNRFVALKMIRAGGLASEEEIARFRAEAAATAQLQHPHIVPIYDVGEHQGQPYFSMAFIEGESLSQRVARGPLELREAARLVQTLAEAVDYAHNRGVVHRDLKPGNVLLDQADRPWITDFGLARWIGQDSNLTHTGQVVGTPSFMSPEQARGTRGDAGPAADIYALGAILYCLITGRPPFQAANAWETVRQVLEAEPVSPRRLNLAIDRDLDTICLKCLEKNPGGRYATAADLAAELGRYLRHEPIHARRTGPVTRAARWCRRKPWIASLVVVSTVAVILAMIIQVRLVATQQTANIYRYFAHLADAGRSMEEALPGCTLQARRDSELAAAIKPASDDGLELRSLTAQVESAWDLQRMGKFPVPKQVGAVTFSADGCRLAIAELLNDQALTVSVYDPTTQQRLREYIADVRAERADNIRRGVERFTPAFKALAFSPDGRWLAAATRQGWIYCWDTQHDAQSPVQVWQDDPAEISRLQFSSDSQRLLATTKVAGTVQVRDLFLQKSLPPIPAVGRYLAVAPGGEHLALGGEKLTVWNLSRSETIATQPWITYAVAFSSCGRWLAAGISKNDVVQILDSSSWQPIKRLHDPTAPEEALDDQLAFGADNQLLIASCRDERVRIWDVDTGLLVMQIGSPGKSFPHTAIDPAGRYLVVAGTSEAILYGVCHPTCWEGIAQGSDLIKAAHFLPGSRQIASIRERIMNGRATNTELTVLSADTDAVIAKTVIAQDLASNEEWFRHVESHIGWDRAGKELIWGFSSGSLCWRRGTQGWESPFSIDTGPLSTSVIEESNFEVKGTGGKSEICNDSVAANGKAIKLLPGGTIRVGLPLEQLSNPSCQALACYVVVRIEGQLYGSPVFESLLELDGQHVSRREVPGSGSPTDSYHLFHVGYVGLSSTAQIPQATISIEAKQPPGLTSMCIDRLILVPLAIPKGPPRGAPRITDQGPFAYSPDGRTVWGIQDEKIVCRWNVGEFGRPRFQIRPLSQELDRDDILRSIHCLGDTVVVGARRGDLFLYDANSGNLRWRAAKYDAPLRCSAVHPGGKIVVVGTDHGNIWAVRVTDGEIIADFAAHNKSVRSLSFSTDGRVLVSGSQGRSLRFWRCSGEQFVELFDFDKLPAPVKSLSWSTDKQRLAVLLDRSRMVRVLCLDRLNDRFKALGVGLSELD